MKGPGLDWPLLRSFWKRWGAGSGPSPDRERERSFLSSYRKIPCLRAENDVGVFRLPCHLYEPCPDVMPITSREQKDRERADWLATKCLVDFLAFTEGVRTTSVCR